MLFSVFYLSLFLSVGLLSARRAVPDGSAAVIVPLGCGFGVSLLAVLPALFAVVLGFTLPAVALAAAAAAGIGAALLYRGTRLRGMAKDPDSGALWACLLPVVLITLYLLHTHVLHLVDGAYHTGQSCYGDMPMHLGFIKYIAQSGEFLPRYPLLGGTHRFGYPFLCETVSSVFVVLGADLRTAYLLPMLPAFLSVYGMFWQLARRVTDSVGKAYLAFYLFFMGSGLGFVYFLGSADSFAGIFTGFYTTPTNFVEKNIEWVNPIVDLLIPQRATLFGWCVLLPAVYLLWRFCYEGERRLCGRIALFLLSGNSPEALEFIKDRYRGGVFSLLHALGCFLLKIPNSRLQLSLCDHFIVFQKYFLNVHLSHPFHADVRLFEICRPYVISKYRVVFVIITLGAENRSDGKQLASNGQLISGHG